MPSQLPVKVADLWNNEKERDNLKLNSQFEEEAVQKILQIPLMQDTSSDKLCWRFTKNGECNSKSAYREFYKRDNQNLQQDNEQSEAGTRRMDTIPNGIRCYLDAAWDNGQTGIGIFFFHNPQNHNAMFIQACSNKAHSALQAELLALQLSLETDMCLNFSGVTYLSDNTTIADTAKKKNFMDDPGHWSLRPFWTQITSSVPIDRI
ncbi:hypothetical protein OsJ_13559 [Oryza sativa Japonica Group]|uniref:RNase H type-1 domain-containing protein n=1 Tax=Oryza sativa subsp. japonica TaxID=39947 RepID=A3AQ95_ORYSJ|nr:hypothetical protein OsJ_13559 [Oryza sativa Japonica Group]